MNGQTLEVPIEHLLRELAPQVLGVVARRFRDFSSAEDAVQEAMLAAFKQWPQEGTPENPRGWLIRVALRRMTDTVRSEIARRRRETAMTTEEEPTIEPAETPDTLLIEYPASINATMAPTRPMNLTPPPESTRSTGLD